MGNPKVKSTIQPAKTLSFNEWSIYIRKKVMEQYRSNPGKNV